MNTYTDQVKVAVAGRCVEVLTTLGVPSEHLASSPERPCPKCGGDTRYREIPPHGEEFFAMYSAVCSEHKTCERSSQLNSGLRSAVKLIERFRQDWRNLSEDARQLILPILEDAITRAGD